MQYTRLGPSGLDVSRICLGCMGFGEAGAGGQDWAIGEDESREVIRAALDAGVNFFDTANAYSAGSSEEIVGRALRDMTNRDEVVIATKVYFGMRRGRNAWGLSRKAILTELEHSLRRLGVDHIDLYQIHRFDPRTPVEETMAALDSAVQSGKVRYIGASSMWAWEFQKMLHTSELGGWSSFISMQNQYNLLMRSDEREMHPLCDDRGIQTIPWSPLARGKLTRAWDAQTTRSGSDANIERRFRGDDADLEIVRRVHHIAEGHGVPPARVAMAWLLSKPTVASPIVGTTKVHHLTDAVASLDLELSDAEVASLEEPYVERGASF